MVGIVSYNAYIPKNRLNIGSIADSWGKNSEEISLGLGVKTKAVPDIDEDAVTMAIEATHGAISACEYILPSDIGAVFVGSESHPYAVNPTSTIVAELLGFGNNYLAADLEFACKAGTAGIRAVCGLIGNKEISLGVAIGSDVAQSRPHDVLEYTSGAGAGAFIMGNESYPLLVKLLDSVSYSSDTPDFWRRDGIRYPSHAGRFTGEPAYFTHVLGAGKMLLNKIKKTPEQITWCVFHSPNGKFPRDAAKRFGFNWEQLANSFVVDKIGNPYSASTLISFANLLDHAKPKDTVFMVSYGSGAGSDAFYWEVTENIIEFQKKRSASKSLVADYLAKIQEIDYITYLKNTHKIP